MTQEAGVVALRQGQVRGVRDGDLWHFAGIPYAKAPMGDLRWRPPVMADSWTGVRECAAFGPIAPQPPPTPWNSVPGDPDTWDEDCLSLNVWTPGLDDRHRPVMVWIHGGAFTSGTGASALYRGTSLAQRGDVVVVSFNYRLGAFGFLAHPELVDPVGGALGNWGLLDQVAALAWVKEHAEVFGGDPGNITVFGESAGGMSISALLASELATDSFKRAIIQSGPPHASGLAEATEVAERLAIELGLSGFDPGDLRRVPAADLLDAQESVAKKLFEENPLGFRPTWLPVIDGIMLDRSPLQAAADGLLPDVEVMIGTNRDEASYFAMADPRIGTFDTEQFYRFARSLVGLVQRERATSGTGAGSPLDPGSVADGYRAARAARGEPVDPSALWTALTSDAVFRLPSLWLAEARASVQPATFAYLFTWESPLLGGILGSAHSVEIPFVFGTLGAPRMDRFAGSGQDADRLSIEMQEAWLAFARTGDPSCETLGPWPAYDDRRPTMVFGTTSEVRRDPAGLERRLWDGEISEAAGS